MSEYTAGADYLAGALDPINIRRQNNVHKRKWWRMVKRAQNGSELLRCIGWGLKCKPTREFESKAKSFLLDALFRGENTTELYRATQIATEWLKSHDRYLRALWKARTGRYKRFSDVPLNLNRHVNTAEWKFWDANLEWTRLWESKQRPEDEEEGQE